MVYKRCTGSRFCGANCPVQARKFNYEDASAKGLAKKFNPEVPLRGRGVMEKCSLCLQRIQNSRMDFKAANSENGSIQIWKGRGLQTACAAACPKNAIIFGNWLDENSDLVKEARQRSIFSPSVIANLDPSVVYLKGRR